MAKYRVAVIGTVGKSVLIDDSLSSRVAKLETQIATTGGVTRHSALTGLQQGDDHPQYTMWAAPETIKAQWNFQTIPYIQGEPLAEYIEDVVAGGSDPFIADSPSITWTYDDTGNHLQADVVDEYIEDLVGSMLANTTYIGLDYGDSDGSIKAILDTGAVLDLVGSQLQDSSTIDFTYNSGTKRTSAAVVQSADYSWTGNHTFTPASGNTKISAGNLQIDVDNLELQLGASQDLRFYHDGTNSAIQNDTGDLNISTVDGNINFAPAGTFPTTGDMYITRNHNERTRLIIKNTNTGVTAACQLTFNNGGSFGAAFALSGTGYSGPWLPNMPSGAAATLYTSGPSGGPLALGTSDIARFVILGDGTEAQFYVGKVRLTSDSDELQLGAGSDLRLYHDGTDSFVRNDTGALWLYESASGGAIKVRRGGGSPFFGFYDSAGTTRNGYLQYQDSGSGSKVVIQNEVSNGDVNIATTGSVSVISLLVDAVEAARFDKSSTAGDMRLFLYDVTAGTLVRVSRGASDSGGTGFRVLRIPN